MNTARNAAALKRRRRRRHKGILAVLSVIIGILAALYLGLYLMFIGGIIQGVNAVQHHPVNASGLAWAIVRVVFAGFVGWVCILVGIAVAGAID